MKGLNLAGIQPGDSLELFFDNGVHMVDVPYHTGFFVPKNEPLVVTYPTASFGLFTHAITANTYRKLDLNNAKACVYVFFKKTNM